MKKKSAAPAAEKRSELFYSGRDCRAFDYMGAHPFVQDGEQGYLFRVYAPEAEKVSVMGEFNDWNRDADYMTRDEQGIWEKFIPNIPEYAAYKYSVWAKSGDVFDKSDPYGFHFETRPGNATKAYDLDGYEWGRRLVAGLAQKAPAVFQSGQHLRMPPRLVEDARGRQLLLPTASWRTSLCRMSKEMGYTHYRVYAADRVSVRRLVGLSLPREF